MRVREPNSSLANNVAGTLHCQRIFGPIHDFECSCGKYRGQQFAKMICDRCGVKIDHTGIRRIRFGHIPFQQEVRHPFDEATKIDCFPVLPNWLPNRNPEKRYKLCMITWSMLRLRARRITFVKSCKRLSTSFCQPQLMLSCGVCPKRKPWHKELRLFLRMTNSLNWHAAVRFPQAARLSIEFVE